MSLVIILFIILLTFTRAPALGVKGHQLETCVTNKKDNRLELIANYPNLDTCSEKLYDLLIQSMQSSSLREETFACTCGGINNYTFTIHESIKDKCSNNSTCKGTNTKNIIPNINNNMFDMFLIFLLILLLCLSCVLGLCLLALHMRYRKVKKELQNMKECSVFHSSSAFMSPIVSIEENSAIYNENNESNQILLSIIGLVITLPLFWFLWIYLKGLW
ncbi:hypothetical protein ABK040_011446 [Willaertia magna]